MILAEAGIENYAEPLGIEGDISFYWKYKESLQSGYQIQIFEENSDLVFDSGKIKSSEQNQIWVRDISWKSLSSYSYQITVWHNEGQESCTAKGSFITGVIGTDQKKAKWISNGNRKPFYALRAYEAKGKIRHAYAAVCGLGQFEFRINGKKVGDHVLDPGWTDYNDQVQYVTFDVTELLQKENVFQIETANGWYLADTIAGRHFYTLDKGYEPFGYVLPLWAVIRVEYDDGEDWIGTDESWNVLKSNTTLANIFGSEDFNGEMYAGESNLLHHVQAKPAVCLVKELSPKGELTAQKHPPVKVKRIYEASFVNEFEKGKYLYDLGQNMSGQFEITVKGKKGQKVFITPVEKLHEDGTPWKTVDTWCCYTLCGSSEPEVWKPKFSYGAGRWIVIEGAATTKIEEKPQILSVKGYFISSSAKDCGDFSCSNEKYNQIYHMIKMAVESNLNHVHTDCPVIEKLGWQEPNHLMAASIMFLKNVDTLWSKIARDMREAQYTEEEWDQDISIYAENYGPGLVPSIAPRYARFLQDGGMGSFWDIVPWGSSIILAPEFQYQFYGNLESIRENYDAGMKYLDYLTDLYYRYPVIYHKNGKERFLCHGLGDWGIGQAGYKESRENTETAIYYADIKVMEKHAALLGKEQDRARLEKLGKEVSELYNETLLVLHPETNEWYYRAYDAPESNNIIQANQAIPLYYGLVPEDKEESVKRSFLKSVESHQFISGEIGLRYIFIMLARYGRNDIVHDMILQKNHPSYYRFIEKGETTLPEFWDDNARSRNHDMMGHIMQWFYEVVGGITTEDAFRHIRIKPCFVKDLTWVLCSYDSIRGVIKVDAKETEPGCKGVMTITVPGNSESEIWIPEKWKTWKVTCEGEEIPTDYPVCSKGGTIHFEAVRK